jgi:Tfp pilus assembly protein PilF
MTSRQRFAIAVALAASAALSAMPAGGSGYLTIPDRPLSTAPAIAGRRVILLGWDGADWELLDALTTSGAMPNLRRLVREGRAADLESYPPTVSPMVWTTIATGADPADHGVLSFFEIEPGSGAHVPVTVRGRKVPAYWDTASSRGQSVGSVGFWASYPAAQVRGFLVSDRACPPLSDPDPKQLPSAAYPPSASDGVRALLAQHPLPTNAEISAFGDFPAADPKREMFARLLRSTRVTQEAAERLYDREHPQSMAVYFLGTDEVAHLFGAQVPPKLPCVSADASARYGRVVERYYAAMDVILGRWMRRAAQDGATLLLVSDHGFKWGKARSCAGSPLERQGAVFAHRPTGVAVAWGRAVRKASAKGKASVFDVEPTVAALLALPVDRLAPGKARTEWFDGVSPPERTDLWSRSPRPKLLPTIAPSKDDEYARRLASLGYISTATRPAAAAPAGPLPTPDEDGWLNLGVYQNSLGKTAQAAESFRRSLAVAPGYPPALVDLVGAELKLGKRAEALARARDAFASGERAGWAVYEIAARLETAGLAAEEERYLEEAARRLPGSEPVLLSLGGVQLSGGRCREARSAVAPFLEKSRNAETFNVAGLACLCLGQKEQARRHLEKSLALNPDQPQIRKALGR